MRWRKVLFEILCTRQIKRTECLWCDYNEDGRMKDKAGSGDVEDHREDHICHEGHWTLSQSNREQELGLT